MYSHYKCAWWDKAVYFFLTEIQKCPWYNYSYAEIHFPTKRFTLPKDLFIWNIKWRREKSSPADSHSTYPHQPGLGRAQARNWNSVCISHKVGRCSCTWAIICCLQGCISRKLHQKQSSWNWNWALQCGMARGHFMWRLNLLPVLQDVFFKLFWFATHLQIFQFPLTRTRRRRE